MRANKSLMVSMFLSIIFILLVGVYMVYSSSKVWANYLYGDQFYFLKRQSFFVIIGFFLMYLGYKIDLNKIRKYNKKLLLFSLLLMVLVLVPFLGVERGGSKSWFGIGSLLFQPSELFKIIIILYISDRLSTNYLKTNKFMSVIIPTIIPVGIGFLLIMLQPDFGSGIVILGSVIVMCMISKSHIKNYIYIGLLGIIGLSILILTAPYRMERITSFIDPFADPLGSGFQIIQSLYAISPGGLIGKGIDASFQKYFYLPEPQTDFIFAIFSEEFGFVGCLILIFAFMLLISSAFKYAIKSNNEYICFIKTGLTSLIAIQVFINLGVVVGLLPVTGITLPYMSYGGSSITLMMLAFGLIINNKGDNINECHISGEW